MKRKLRILLADDQIIVRFGLRRILELTDSFECYIAEVDNGAEVLKALLEEDFDIVLMDIEMPRLDGIATVEKMRLSRNFTPVLFLSVHSDLHIIRQAIHVGGNGYLLKCCNIHDLVEAINKVSDGGDHFCTEVVQMTDGLKKKRDLNMELIRDLTSREWQVLKMLADDITNEEIAKELSISVRTIEGYRLSLKNKLQVNSLAGIVKFAYRNGYCE